MGAGNETGARRDQHPAPAPLHSHEEERAVIPSMGPILIYGYESTQPPV